MNEITLTQSPIVALIETRQTQLALTDQQLNKALGFTTELTLKHIKVGNIMFPVGKAPDLSRVLMVSILDVLRAALAHSPDIFSAIEKAVAAEGLSPADANLIKHVRKLAKVQPLSPTVFDGGGVVALVMNARSL